jgi:hypothetical protein
VASIRFKYVFTIKKVRLSDSRHLETFDS